MSEGVAENQEEKTSAPTDLRTSLQEIFNANMDTYAHGTRVEAAEKIINEGLKAKAPDLEGTALSLFDHRKSFEEQIDGVIKKIEKWPHLESEAIVIIMLPRIKQVLAESIETKNNAVQIGGIFIRTAPFFREIPGEHDTAYGLPYILPSKYIAGFVDVMKKEFIKNPLFNPTPPEPMVNQRKKKLSTEAPTNLAADKTPPIDLLP